MKKLQNFFFGKKPNFVFDDSIAEKFILKLTKGISPNEKNNFIQYAVHNSVDLQIDNNYPLPIDARYPCMLVFSGNTNSLDNMHALRKAMSILNPSYTFTCESEMH